MSEAAEKIFPAPASEQVPAESAKTAASTPQPKRKLTTKSTHRQLLALAAVGSTFGFLMGWGLWNEIHFHSVEFVLLAILGAFVGYVLMDPTEDWLLGKHGSDQGATERRSIAALTTAAVASLFDLVYDRSLDAGKQLSELSKDVATAAESSEQLRSLATNLSKMGEKLDKGGELCTVLIAFLGVGVAAIVVTHFWAQGARRRPPRALHRSAAIGLFFSLFVVTIAIAYLARINLLRYWPSWVLAALGVFWFAIPAYAGGLALQRIEADSSPTRAIRTYLLFSSAFYLAAYAIFAAVAGYVFYPYKEKIYGWIWLPIAALVGQNLGWALGPYFRRDLCDDYLRCPEDESVPAPALQKASNVISMPDPEGSPAVTQSAPTMATRAARAKDLLFKPKGDRLLATAGLILALLTSAFAYHLGTLRGDPDIRSNIDERLKQDSGLETKDLKVVSDRRVVTISGTVEDQAEHAKAIREISAVRGVKQIIDQIQIVAAAPAPTPAPAQPVPTAPARSAPPTSAINAAVSVDISHGAGNPSTATAQKQPKTPDTPKHRGVFDIFKKNGQAKAATAQKQGSPTAAQNSRQTPSAKPADENQKKGLFHFLKKNKKNKNDNTQK